LNPGSPKPRTTAESLRAETDSLRRTTEQLNTQTQSLNAETESILAAVAVHREAATRHREATRQNREAIRNHRRATRQLVAARKSPRTAAIAAKRKGAEPPSEPATGVLLNPEPGEGPAPPAPPNALSEVEGSNAEGSNVAGSLAEAPSSVAPSLCHSVVLTPPPMATHADLDNLLAMPEPGSTAAIPFATPHSPIPIRNRPPPITRIVAITALVAVLIAGAAWIFWPAPPALSEVQVSNSEGPVPPAVSQSKGAKSQGALTLRPSIPPPLRS
jgi:hypothetical protein